MLVKLSITLTVNYSISFCNILLSNWFQDLANEKMKSEALKSSVSAKAAEVSEAQGQGFKEGFDAGKKASDEDATSQVKRIMNTVYQKMAAEFKKKENFTSKEVLSITLGTIRVRVICP